MPTLYLRNVPEGVAARLRERADREGVSLNALAVRELTAASERPSNADLLNALPSYPISAEEIVAAIEEGRRERD